MPVDVVTQSTPALLRSPRSESALVSSMSDPPEWVRQIVLRLDGLVELVKGRVKSHLTVSEVAEITGRSAFTVRRWVGEGRLPATRIDAGGPRGRLLIKQEHLEQFLSGLRPQ